MGPSEGGPSRSHSGVHGDSTGQSGLGTLRWKAVGSPQGRARVCVSNGTWEPGASGVHVTQDSEEWGTRRTQPSSFCKRRDALAHRTKSRGQDVPGPGTAGMTAAGAQGCSPRSSLLLLPQLCFHSSGHLPTGPSSATGAGVQPGTSCRPAWRGAECRGALTEGSNTDPCVIRGEGDHPKEQACEVGSRQEAWPGYGWQLPCNQRGEGIWVGWEWRWERCWALQVTGQWCPPPCVNQRAGCPGALGSWISLRSSRSSCGRVCAACRARSGAPALPPFRLWAASWHLDLLV